MKKTTKEAAAKSLGGTVGSSVEHGKMYLGRYAGEEVGVDVERSYREETSWWELVRTRHEMVCEGVGAEEAMGAMERDAEEHPAARYNIRVWSK